jgi:hypothetical protein
MQPHGVSIENEDSKGRSSCSVYSLVSGNDHNRQEIEQQIMFSLAGSLAEEQLGANRMSTANLGVRQDHQLAVVLALYVTSDPLETHAYIDWLAIRTLNLLRRPTWWVIVLGLADRLMNERTMPATRCHEAIQESIEARFSVDHQSMVGLADYEGDGDRRVGVVSGRRLTDMPLMG